MRLLPLLALLMAAAHSQEQPGVADHTHLNPSSPSWREHSLAPPYLNAGMAMAFWDFVGHTVISDQYIRLTPDRQSKRGGLWNTRPMLRNNWEVTVQFKVHGQGRTLCGDGFAMWFTKEKEIIGDVFGSKNPFTGLGVFFDTYSNQQSHHRGGAYISALVNDGTINYDHDADGTHQQLAACTADIRNKDFPTYARITYRNRALKVQLDVNNEHRWSTCFYVPDVYLPTGYFLGFSAATGDLADNHDIISINLAEPPAITAEETQEIKAMEQAKEKEGNVDGERLPDDAEIKEPHARFHDKEREHVGPIRTKPEVNIRQVIDRMRREKANSIAPSSMLLYGILAVVLVLGVGGVIYKVRVIDKKKAQRFTF